MKREIVNHKVNDSDPLRVVANDSHPGVSYVIDGFDYGRNDASDTSTQQAIKLLFQNGPIPANGVNGLTNEVLISVLIDRLKTFQGGPHRCKENACAITKLEEALMWLQHRTIDRRRRNVEGTSNK